MRARRKNTRRARISKRKLARAVKDFQKIQQELAPFLKQRRFRVASTAGQWTESCSTGTD